MMKSLVVDGELSALDVCRRGDAYFENAHISIRFTSSPVSRATMSKLFSLLGKAREVYLRICVSLPEDVFPVCVEDLLQVPIIMLQVDAACDYSISIIDAQQVAVILAYIARTRTLVHLLTCDFGQRYAEQLAQAFAANTTIVSIEFHTFGERDTAESGIIKWGTTIVRVLSSLLERARPISLEFNSILRSVFTNRSLQYDVVDLLACMMERNLLIGLQLSAVPSTESARKRLSEAVAVTESLSYMALHPSDNVPHDCLPMLTDILSKTRIESLNCMNMPRPWYAIVFNPLFLNLNSCVTYMVPKEHENNYSHALLRRVDVRAFMASMDSNLLTIVQYQTLLAYCGVATWNPNPRLTCRRFCNVLSRFIATYALDNVFIGRCYANAELRRACVYADMKDTVERWYTQAMGLYITSFVNREHAMTTATATSTSASASAPASTIPPASWMDAWRENSHELDSVFSSLLTYGHGHSSAADSACVEVHWRVHCLDGVVETSTAECALLCNLQPHENAATLEIGSVPEFVRVCDFAATSLTTSASASAPGPNVDDTVCVRESIRAVRAANYLQSKWLCERARSLVDVVSRTNLLLALS